MRVGFDATLHGARTTGAGEYQRQLLLTLPGMVPDLDLLVYTARGDAHTPRAGLAVREMPWAPGERVRRILQGGFAWRRRWREDRLDLLHVPFYYLPPGAPDRSIVTIYDARFLRYPETYPRARAAFLRRAVPWSLRRATRVVTISEFTRRELVELLGLDPARIQVTLLAPRAGFEPVRDPERLAAVRARYQLPPRFILCTSTLEPRKNLARVVEAFAELRARGVAEALVLAGVRYFGTRDMERAISRHNLAGAVHLPGYIDDEDMAALYSLAQVFIYPSLYEGFGIPPLEAMATGTPVVASNTTSIPEVVGTAACPIDPLDVGSIVAGLERVLKDPAYADGLREEGFRRVREFSWQRTAHETLAVYREVLAEGSGA
jgi:glycosyltransferase involved in cell wall biosynthesis